VKYIEKGEFPDTSRNFSVMRCNHCEDSPCTDVCPVTALWEREDGIVDFDTDRCIGCKACMQGCPYDALYIDPETHTASKCNYCSHRVDTGREPACVTVCPEDAIIAGDMENSESDIADTLADQEVQVRKPEKGTEPKLFYIDGDEASITPGTTGREEHYMWSDAPNQIETRGAAREEFDLRKAAESLAESGLSLPDDDARADGGKACGCDSCRCGQQQDTMATDDGNPTDGSTADTSDNRGSRTERAYELVHNEAKRVYDIGENHYQSWGWEVYSYTWTKSIAAGAFLIPALLMLGGIIDTSTVLLGTTSLISGVFLALTGVLLVLDLDRPKRFHWVLLRPNWRSWLVKGAYIISGFGLFLGLVVLDWLTGSSLLTHPVVLGIGSLLAAATAIYTAFLFSQSKGRDLWQSPAMPIHMLTQAVIGGGAVVAVMSFVGYPELLVQATWTLGIGVIAHAALVASEIFTPHQTEDAEEAAARITRGRFSGAFWYGGVLAGMVLPLVGLTVGGPGIVTAGFLALVGLFAFEYCWITAPQTISLA
jgi:Fe-S-cluster-containing dehydrogenase component/formate-dependent nitrite reductase membrane component NrfD